MNRNGSVIGVISLYRSSNLKFSEDEFRRLELISSQTALALSMCDKLEDEAPMLFDSTTNLPNGYQLYYLFDQVATDAQRYDYPVALLTIRLDQLTRRRHWGQKFTDESLQLVAKAVSEQLRETDLLVRYAADEFIALTPRIDRDHAEALKSRLQDALDHLHITTRGDSNTNLGASIGIAIFPEDSNTVESLITAAEWRMREDFDLRSAIRRGPQDLPAGL